MPELPEVQRAVNILLKVAKGKRITNIEAFPDSIVYSDTTNEEFVKELDSRIVVDAKRYGKVFYLCLDGNGKVPVLHFGMTGMLQVKGVTPMYYKEGPRKKDDKDVWPPRFCKFVLRLQGDTSPHDDPPVEIAFLDARRLARIRLCSSPTEEPPISNLGFDPILSMPPLNTFSPKILKRSCPIKALLLDQSFSAGVGNWVADEVLYHSQIHPEQRCNTLTPEQITKLHTNVVYVCQTAVDVNADHRRFPENWLFRHRWGKGKRKLELPLLLPSGETATIRWLKVGGRTSAYVVQLQKLSGSTKRSKDTQSEEESELSSLSEPDTEPPLQKATARKNLKRKSTEDITETSKKSRKTTDEKQPSQRSSQRLKQLCK